MAEPAGWPFGRYFPWDLRQREGTFTTYDTSPFRRIWYRVGATAGIHSGKLEAADIASVLPEQTYQPIRSVARG